ncbi:MAG: RecQ family ATP-dependent DNA helicase [Candidatus Dormibacteraeota bacterium]|nr:RecQ family ATP-dependent DNA helicase [Candidatus Dormibacteraeota bacterium]
MTSPTRRPELPSAAARAALKETFGLAAFRPGQGEMVAAAEVGADVLFVAPTGSGKSIAYWVPGIVAGGLTIVVSPLIALMVDQVTHLQQLGVSAAFLHSQMAASERSAAMTQAERGQLRFLYLAPERIGTAGFLEWLGRLQVSRFVVDEAHCISSWGHDFRPDYRRLEAAISACGRPPVGAFTATATPRVRLDIVASLGLREPAGKVTGFVRENLHMMVISCRGKAEKRDRLLERIRYGDGRSLVYCGTRASADEVALLLAEAGLPADSYHGALDGDQRQAVYSRFAAGQVRIIAATSAFGMGIDFPDIRQVIHYDFPGSLEEYYQQAGRAGRDGQPAECILLYSPQDRRLQEFFIEQAFPERDVVRAVYREMLRAGSGLIPDWPLRLPTIDASAIRGAVALLERAQVVDQDGGIRRLTGAPVDFDEQAALKEHAYARVTQVMDYARSRGCRHARIADYFGEEGVARTCHSCDNCLGLTEVTTTPVAPADVEVALQAVGRFSAHLGAARIALILHGDRDVWERAKPWVAELPFFGALGKWELARVRDLIAALVEKGLVARGHSEKPTVSLTESGRLVLAGRQGEAVELADQPRSRKRPPSELTGDALDFLDALRRWRLDTARRAEVPPYVVFHDKTLAEIARRRPGSVQELAQVPGIGPAKLERYGADLMLVLGRN